jgi:pantoate--beta-alanine ligase
MYPEKDTRVFDFGSLATVMEGAHRPGHFNGVAQIVSKLFDAVLPHKAFFGQKDFQQYVIVKALVRQMQSDIEIVACPIVREKSGLAMSSRNQRLSEKQLEQASEISNILFWAKDNYRFYSVADLKIEVIKRFKSSEGLELEYFEISEDEGLQAISNWDIQGKIVACVALFCGNVRLIDNIVFNL